MRYLEHFAKRASKDSFFLGYILDGYAWQRRLSAEGLADELGCSLEDLTRLRLCRRPETDDEVIMVCEACHVHNRAALATILKGTT